MTGGDHTVDTPAFRELVRAHRLRCRLTQEDLAERTGLSVRSIGKLEAGRVCAPRQATLRLLADAFGLAATDRDTFWRTAAGDTAGTSGSRSADQHRPTQLPADVPMFTGRGDQLAELDGLLTGIGQQPTAVVAAVSGAAGVGKTALAVRWAHRVRDQFPDGQLFANLYGYAPGPPLAPFDVLTRFLRAFGVPREQVPLEVDEAAARLRSLLSERRVLVLLDNAAGADQVRPLLPAGGGCLVLITSRDQLGGLLAHECAHLVKLDVLVRDEAGALLSRRLGPRRLAAEPAAIADLAEVCGFMPLALQIAAANLTVHSEHRVHDYVSQLRGGGRLESLAVSGDPHRTVTAALDFSYARLPEPARRMFRLLGLLPGEDITAAAGAALAGATPAETGQWLGTLARAHMVEEHAGRYSCHDLLRHYAADVAEREEDPAERDAARARLLAWYHDSATHAGRELYPEMVRLPAATATPGPPAGHTTGPAAAQEWLDTELPNLLAAIGHAAEHGPAPLAWRLADELRGYWWQAGSLRDWLVAAQHALGAARRDGDLPGQVSALVSLGDVQQRQGRYEQALGHYGEAMKLARQAGWAEARSAILSNQARIAYATGRLDQAADQLGEALALNERLGRPIGNVLSNLGLVDEERGQLARAAEHHARALAIHRMHRNRDGEAISLTNLGKVITALGRLEQARAHLTRALAIRRETGRRYGEANVLLNLAATERDAGRYQVAGEAAGSAVRLTVELGDPRAEAEARNILGTVHRQQRRLRAAVEEHQRALHLARAGGDRQPELASRLGLAAALRDLGLVQAAREYAANAFQTARQIGSRLREGQALTVLAGILLDQGDASGARERAEAALAWHRRAGHRLGEAQTLLVLGHAHMRGREVEAAHHHWQRAHQLFRHIGCPEADETAALLATARAGTLLQDPQRAAA